MKKRYKISAVHNSRSPGPSQKYKVLKYSAMKQKSQILPCRNYDMDLKYTSLHERDLHLRWHDMRGLKIAGMAEPHLDSGDS